MFSKTSPRIWSSFTLDGMVDPVAEVVVPPYRSTHCSSCSYLTPVRSYWSGSAPVLLMSLPSVVPCLSTVSRLLMLLPWFHLGWGFLGHPTEKDAAPTYSTVMIWFFSTLLSIHHRRQVTLSVFIRIIFQCIVESRIDPSISSKDINWSTHNRLIP